MAIGRARIARRRLPALLCLTLLVACTTAPPAGRPAHAPAAPGADAAAEVDRSYAQLRARGEPVLHIDAPASEVRILAFRGGRFPRLGHNHVLTAPRFTGYVLLRADRASAQAFDLVFRLDELGLDQPEVRAQLGPAFAPALDAADIAATREHLLGADGLQADAYPQVRIQATEVRGEAPWFHARVAVTLHGQTREQTLPIRVEGLPERLEAQGDFVLRQTDFGIRPYALFGGALAVEDGVQVHFRLRARP